MVTARDNSPGFHQFWEDRQWTKYQYDSYWSDPWGDPPYELHSAGPDMVPVHSCGRSQKVNNPMRMLSPGGPLWRDPGPYNREIVEVNWIRGTWRKEFHGLNYLGKPYTQITVEDAVHHENLFSWDFSESRYSLAGGGPAFPTNEENRALAKAYDKLKGDRAEWGENLAQAVGTYRQLRGDVMSLLYAARAVKHGNFGLALRWLRGNNRGGAAVDVSNQYLKWKFGWLPLATDIYALSGLLQQQLQSAQLMYAVGTMPKVTTTLLPKSGYERSGNVKVRGHVKLVGSINETRTRLPEQLGLNNPAKLAWDLIPWSFVVDWVIPVGNALDSLVPPVGLDFVGGYASARFSGEFRSKLICDEWSGFKEISPRVNEYRVFNLMRRTYGDWPKVGLYVKSPFSASHGATSIALFIQKLLK
jgi:hypothetical protein